MNRQWLVPLAMLILFECVKMNPWMVMYAAGLRPGRMVHDGGASAHVLGYHDLSRLTELLLLWRLDSIKYPEIAYVARQIDLTPQSSGVG